MGLGFELVEVSAPPALGPLSVGAPSGAVTALVGARAPARAAFRLAAGLDRPATGAVLIGGEDISSASTRRLRRVQRRMAFVFEAGADATYALFADGTVDENLRYAIAAAGRTSRRRLGAQVAGELARYGIGDLARARPADLDRGERKLVALARATALRSPLLLVDDLDSDLGPGAMERVAGVLREHSRERLGACLITTADGGVAAAVADQAVRVG